MIGHEMLNEAARRLVEKFHPDRIILFGSHARGTADDRSDVDFLVITRFSGKRRQVMLEMDRALGELDAAFDIVVLTEEEFEEECNIPGTIGRYAAKEGKVLYERH